MLLRYYSGNSIYVFRFFTLQCTLVSVSPVSDTNVPVLFWFGSFFHFDSIFSLMLKPIRYHTISSDQWTIRPFVNITYFFIGRNKWLVLISESITLFSFRSYGFFSLSFFCLIFLFAVALTAFDSFTPLYSQYHLGSTLSLFSFSFLVLSISRSRSRSHAYAHYLPPFHHFVPFSSSQLSSQFESFIRDAFSFQFFQFVLCQLMSALSLVCPFFVIPINSVSINGYKCICNVIKIFIRIFFDVIRIIIDLLRIFYIC